MSVSLVSREDAKYTRRRHRRLLRCDRIPGNSVNFKADRREMARNAERTVKMPRGARFAPLFSGAVYSRAYYATNVKIQRSRRKNCTQYRGADFLGVFCTAVHVVLECTIWCILKMFVYNIEPPIMETVDAIAHIKRL